MLDRAATTDSAPGLRFQPGEIEAFPGGTADYDLVFSNAALHWVEDHETLFARLAAALARHGQLAVQMPAMHDEISHLVAADIFATAPYPGGQRRMAEAPAGAVAERLRDPDVSFRFQRSVSAPDRLSSCLARSRRSGGMGEGDAPRGYSRHLPPDVFERFLAEYRERLLAQLGDERPFLFPFKRILLWGQRA